MFKKSIYLGISLGIIAIPATGMSQVVPNGNMYQGFGTATYDGTDFGHYYDYRGTNTFFGSLNYSFSSTLNPYLPSTPYFITTPTDIPSIGTQTGYNVSNPYPEGGAVLAGAIIAKGSATATDNNHAAALELAMLSAELNFNVSTQTASAITLAGESKAVQKEEDAYLAAGEVKSLQGSINSFDDHYYFYNEPNGSGTSLYQAWAPTTTPEPSSFALMGLGFAGLIGIRRRKPKAKSQLA